MKSSLSLVWNASVTTHNALQFDESVSFGIFSVQNVFIRYPKVLTQLHLAKKKKKSFVSVPQRDLTKSPAFDFKNFKKAFFNQNCSHL